VNTEQRYEVWVSCDRLEVTMISSTLADQGKCSEYPPVDEFGRPTQKFISFEAANWAEAGQIRNDVFGYGPYTKMVESEGPTNDWSFRRYIKLSALQWKVPLDGGYYRNITDALDFLWDTFSEETKMCLKDICLLTKKRGE